MQSSELVTVDARGASEQHNDNEHHHAIQRTCNRRRASRPAA
jgi:hypothetical protein